MTDFKINRLTKSRIALNAMNSERNSVSIQPIIDTFIFIKRIANCQKRMLNLTFLSIIIYILKIVKNILQSLIHLSFTF